jgi:hypothetical protein
MGYTSPPNLTLVDVIREAAPVVTVRAGPAFSVMTTLAWAESEAPAAFVIVSVIGCVPCFRVTDRKRACPADWPSTSHAYVDAF